MRLIAALLVAALGARVLYLFVSYVFALSNTQRFHVESAALIFVALGLALRLAQHRGREDASINLRALPRWTFLVFCALAFALYWPALSVGFLSDDFVLVSRASSWQLGGIGSGLFRPVPLFGWGLALNVGAGAVVLHLVNVLLHATNAYLTVRIVKGWLPDTTWSILAGLIVLTAPLAPEAVVWCSGVFDVVATTLVLTAVLVARRYAHGVPVTTRICFLVLGLLAVLSKETAAVGVVLVLLDAWARKAFSRSLFVDAGILVAVVGAFSIARLLSAFGLTTPPVDKYTLQRVIFGSFGPLGVPWHADVARESPWFPIAGVVVLLFVMTVFFVRSGSRQGTRLAVAAAGWVLIPIMPVWSMHGVDPDLQGSRYLYLPAVGWASLVAILASKQAVSDYLRRLSVGAVVGLIVIAAFGTRLHLTPWIEAARLRDRVERSAVETMAGCQVVRVTNLPDSVRGAYVFRNGVVEAFARDLHLTATVAAGRGPCIFRWDEAAATFVRSNH